MEGGGMKEKPKAVAYIDTLELAVRIAEACIGNQRPANATAEEAFAQLQEMDSETAFTFSRAALASAAYLAECCNAANPGSIEIRRVQTNGSGGLIV
jgi:hypothetical protein